MDGRNEPGLLLLALMAGTLPLVGGCAARDYDGTGRTRDAATGQAAARTPGELAAFLLTNADAAAVVRDRAPVCRGDTPACRAAKLAAIDTRPGHAWIGLAPAGPDQLYYVEQLRLLEQWPLRFGIWIQRGHAPDYANPYPFHLASWRVDCAARSYSVETELVFSAEGDLISARRGALRPIVPPADAGEAKLLGELCRGRTENPPPNQPFE